ncbi:hypothetical protein GGF46_004715 [Coemansia sp. RSA 552]|nr:hypothetical protein GGF46_004715 [Coemansia sp. RSA 552]
MSTQVDDRPFSITSTRTESDDGTPPGTLTNTHDSVRDLRQEKFSSPAERSTVVLQRRHSGNQRRSRGGVRIRGHQTPPPHYYSEGGVQGRRKSSGASLDDPTVVLNSSQRFAQQNYECSFCSGEEPTFQKMLDHISVAHPWYDLSIHRNIR